MLWLAKFPAKNDAYDMAIVEVGAMNLARAAGLTVPPLRVISVGTSRVLLVRRFDRYWAPPGQSLPALMRGYDTQPLAGTTEGRIPQVSALTMMGCPEMDSATKSYKDLAQTIREQERRLHLSVGIQGKLATLDNAMSEFAAFVTDKPSALAVIRRVWSAVRNWKDVFEAHGATPALIKTLDQAIRPLGEIASPALERELRRTAQ